MNFCRRSCSLSAWLRLCVRDWVSRQTVGRVRLQTTLGSRNLAHQKKYDPRDEVSEICDGDFFLGC